MQKNIPILYLLPVLFYLLLVLFSFSPFKYLSVVKFFIHYLIVNKGSEIKKMTMTTKNKKHFKLNVMGLFTWESEEWTVKEVRSILIMIMIFILLIIILLKFYAIPTFGTPMLINKIGSIGKILKPRAP